MTVHKIGVRAPEGSENLWSVRGVYNPDTGMSGAMLVDTLPAKNSTVYYVTTEHDAVGLVTWYEVGTLEEADHFLDQLKAVEVAEEVEVA